MRFILTLVSVLATWECKAQEHDSKIPGEINSPSDTLATGIRYRSSLGSRLSPVRNDSTVIIINGETLVLRTSVSNLSFPESSSFSTESEIRRAEMDERDALYKRDTAALKRLWRIDFFIGRLKANEVLLEPPTIPYYATFLRIVESVSFRDGLAYVHGIDNTSVISKTGDPIQPKIHRFIHIWQMFGSQWKMISKFPNDY